MQKRYNILLVVLLLNITIGFSQHCMQGYRYRVAVEVSVSEAISSGLVEINFDAESLIAANKMQSNCADIRFLDANGINLRHWLDEDNPKSASQSVWVELKAVPASGTTIYMFYGNIAALPASTEDIFDEPFYNFNGTTLPPEWGTCTGSAGIENGKLVLTDNTVINLSTDYTLNYSIEARVSSVTGTNAIASIGQSNAINQGYALSYTNAISNFEVRHVRNEVSCSEPYVRLGGITASGATGEWRFSWNQSNRVVASSPGMDSDEINISVSEISSPTPANFFISLYGAGTMEIDWLRIRDLNAAEISSVLGVEETIGFSPDIEITSNAPICASSSNLELQATLIEGAEYQWYYNGTLFDWGNEKVVPNIAISQSGTYSLSIDFGTAECNTKNAEIEVVVDAPLNPGQISQDTTVCASSNSGQVELTGYSSSIGGWQVLVNGFWEDRLIYENYLPYSGLSSTVSVRAIVKSGECGSTNSDEMTIYVDEASNSGTLDQNAVVCQGNTDELNLTGSTGTIQWQNSTDEISWNTIENITAESYTYDPLYDTTYFRTLVKNGVCQQDTSNTIEISVNPPTVGGIVEHGKTVCAGRTEKDTLYLTGYTGEIKQWEYAPTVNGPWTVQTAGENYFIYQGLQFDSYYRAKLESPGCNVEYSQVDTVFVEAQPTSGNLTGSAEVCATSNQGYLQLNAYTGKVVAWHQSYDGSSWTRTESNYDTINYRDLLDTIQYRVELNTQNEVCAPVYSEKATIVVAPSTVEGNLFPDTIRACVGEDIDTLKLTNNTGEIQRWESSTTGGAPWATINSSSNYLKIQSLMESTHFRVAVKSGVCEELITEATYIHIDDESEGGIISGSTEVCEALNDGKISLFGHKGSVVKWEAFTNGPNWITIPNVSGVEYTYTNLTDTTYYRTILKNGVCPNDTSTTAKITVNPLPDMAFTANTVNLGDPTEFQNNSTIPGGLIQTWLWNFGDEESSASKNPGHTYSNEGNYRVKLSAISNKGCLDSVSHTVTVFGLPDVNFTFGNVCLYESMIFTNTSSTTSGTTYIWNFGDGSSLQQSVDATHNYLSYGSYTVTLKAISTSGGVDSVQKTVQVYPRAVPNFQTENICVGTEAHFSNFTQSETPYLSYLWHFGNGETDQRTDPDVNYTEAGNYPVKLVVTTNNNCSDSILKNILVFPNPVAEFMVEDVPYEQPSVFLNQSAIDYGNLSYEWNFGDENYSEITNPVYYYKAPGVYPVSLTATSDSGCINIVEKAVTIFDLPVVKFTANNVCFGDSVSFQNESTIPSGTLSFEWDFGDRNESETEHPYYTYSAPGIYTVRLISISDNGARDTVWNDVQVYELPNVDFTFSEACYGYSTKFENLCTVNDGEISSVLWDFNDGSNSVQLEPEKEYLNPGIYNVNLKAFSSTGCTNERPKDVIVHHNPVADFSVEALCLNHTSEFVNTSFIDNSDRPYTLVYNWNFDDGQISEDFEPSHLYRNANGYQVQLVVSSDAGCRDTIYRLAEVYPLPEANAGKDTIVELGFPINLQATGGTLYEWTPADGLTDALLPDTEARPLETTTYTLRVSDDNNCTNFDTLTITVEDAMRIIPSNVLTPNNNGENDTWNIVNIDAYPQAEITIFDRWGKVIYETTQYNNDWQGVNSNGDILPDGTYYYIVELNAQNPKVYKGAITILRDK